METNKKISIAILTLFALGLLAGTFSIGVAVGFRKARFSYAWGEQYDRNFGGPRHGVFGVRQGAQFMDAHGTYGKVIKVKSMSFVVASSDDLEKVILVDEKTSIRSKRIEMQLADIKIDDQVTVIGEPNEQGQIVAKFIRILP